MKIQISLFASALLLIASCASDVPEVYPDGSDEIKITLSKGISLRTAADYRDWNSATDPTTMGVVAFTNGTPDPYIYNNVEFTAPAEGTTWTAATKAYWRNYTAATSLDFFGYMPRIADAAVCRSGSTYTLTLPNVPGVSSMSYLVATTPVHYGSAYGNMVPVPMQMDQLMTAFEFQFELGEAMSDLRTFKITKVKMSEIPASATVAQAYTFAEGAWTKGAATISAVAPAKTSVEVASTKGIKIGYPNSEAVSFPNMLYMLPFDLSEVIPKIEVTYDVYDQDGYKTRSTTSTILLNEANFGTLGTVVSAHKNTIKIKIVPNNLHILSDADQSTAGYLVINS